MYFVKSIDKETGFLTVVCTDNGNVLMWGEKQLESRMKKGTHLYGVTENDIHTYQSMQEIVEEYLQKCRISDNPPHLIYEISGEKCIVKGIQNPVRTGCLHVPAFVTTVQDNAIRQYQGYVGESRVILRDLYFDGSTAALPTGVLQGLQGLRRAELPKNNSRVPTDCFKDCCSLEYVRMPLNTTTIGGSAFQHCKQLVDINMPETVKKIGQYAFDGCERMNVIIPPSVENIGDYAFRGTGVSAVIFGDNLRSLNSGAFFGSSVETVAFPEMFRAVHSYAFAHCSYLNDVGFFNHIELIARGAFECSGIQRLTVVDNAATYVVGEYAFRRCVNLSEVHLGVGLRNVAEGVFDGCTGLESIKLPFGVQQIRMNAFRNCTSLRYAKLPDTLTYIRSYAFKGCKNLDKILIPYNARVEEDAFAECSGAELIVYEGSFADKALRKDAAWGLTVTRIKK